MDGIIGAVLLLVLLIVLAVPVVHDATIEKEWHNNAASGALYGTGAITIYKSGSSITANGTAVTAPSNIILWADNLYIEGNTLYAWDNGIMSSYSLTTNWTLRLTSSGSLTVYTETGSGANYQYIERYAGQVSLGSAYHLKPAGNYAYVGSTSALSGVRIDHDSTVIGLSLGSNYMIVYGDADNRLSYVRSASGGIGDATLAAEWSDEERCYTISNLSGNLNGSTVSPSKIFVPAQYYSEEDKDGTAYQILKIIPLLIAIGIALALVYAMRRKRYA